MLGKMFKRRLGFAMAGILTATTVFAGRGLNASAASTPGITEVGGWFESAYVEWSALDDATGYNVYVNDGSGERLLDDELIRLYTSESGDRYFRADALGLSSGSYSFKVVPVEDGQEQSSLSSVTDSVYVMENDRSGFAFVNGSSNGAYNFDGTLKDNAVVLYITNETKDTVSLDVVTNAKGATQSAAGLQNILNLYKKGYDSRPLDVRFVGQITDFATMEGGDIVISGSGDSKRVSCGITFEGVGEDATADGWGLRIKNASNVEVRNLGFMNCDSSEGDDLGLQQSNDHIWVHNCDFFYGYAGGDADQAKGDGALDTKKSTYVTHSYNHFYDTGKSNLQGMKSESTENYITYHHNWYDHSDSRHPRIRTCSVHIYNNYYDGNAKYGVGVTMGASAFVEGNYYRNCKFPMLISEQGSDVMEDWDSLTRNEDYGTFSSEDGGIIKSFNNHIEGAQSYVTYQENSAEFDAYEVSSRDEQVPSEVVSYKGGNSYNNFDTSGIMYSYSADDPDSARDKVVSYSGRENGGDFKWEFNNETDDTDYGVNRELKSALNSYSTKLVSVGGNGNPNASSGSSDEAGEASSDASSEASSDASGEGTSESSSEASSENGEGASEASSEASSEAGTETPAPEQGEVSNASYVHNFTASGNNSDFYTITGNLSTSKGTVTYKDKVLTQCLKIESKTSVKFTAPKAGKLTLVFGAGDSSIKLDGDAVKETTNVMVLDITAGAHELTKKDVENLFYIEFVVEGAVESEQPGQSDESSSEASSEASSEENSGSESSSEASSEAGSEENSGSESSSEASSEAGSEENTGSESSSEASSEASSEDNGGAGSSSEASGETGSEQQNDPAPVETETKATLVTRWGTTYYVTEDGEKLTGIYTIDGKDYLFGENGAMKKNHIAEYNGNKYHADADGVLTKSELFKSWGTIYYFGDDGAMVTDKCVTVDGETYYFQAGGGAAKNQVVSFSDGSRYFDGDGHMVTGLMKKWGTIYYFNEYGVMGKDTLVTEDGDTYYITKSGYAAKNEFVDFEDGTRFFDGDGHMVYGKTISYWFVKYTFDENGILVE